MQPVWARDPADAIAVPPPRNHPARGRNGRERRFAAKPRIREGPLGKFGPRIRRRAEALCRTVLASRRRQTRHPHKIPSVSRLGSTDGPALPREERQLHRSRWDARADARRPQLRRAVRKETTMSRPQAESHDEAHELIDSLPDAVLIVDPANGDPCRIRREKSPACSP